jgi:hypothetical protein
MGFHCMFQVWVVHVFTLDQIEIILALAFLEGLLALFILLGASLPEIYMPL